MRKFFLRMSGAIGILLALGSPSFATQSLTTRILIPFAQDQVVPSEQEQSMAVGSIRMTRSLAPTFRCARIATSDPEQDVALKSQQEVFIRSMLEKAGIEAACIDKVGAQEDTFQYAKGWHIWLEEYGQAEKQRMAYNAQYVPTLLPNFMKKLEERTQCRAKPVERYFIVECAHFENPFRRWHVALSSEGLLKGNLSLQWSSGNVVDLPPSLRVIAEEFLSDISQVFGVMIPPDIQNVFLSDKAFSPLTLSPWRERNPQSVSHVFEYSDNNIYRNMRLIFPLETIENIQ